MDQRISRDHVEQVLARVGIATNEREALLNQLDYPADVNDVMRLLSLTRDQLTNMMGGSP
jgi:uncharacterized protein YpiB (UPF0302 family)